MAKTYTEPVGFFSEELQKKYGIGKYYKPAKEEEKKKTVKKTTKKK